MKSFQNTIQDWLSTPGHKHAAVYYPSDHVLVKSLYKYVNEGINAGDSCVVITNPGVVKRLRKALENSGIGKGSCTVLSAESVLEDFLVDDMPDRDKFFQKINKILNLNSEPGQHVRIYGDMMNTLCKRGNEKAAIELEKLWNEFSKKYSFSVFCAYPSHILLKGDTLPINELHELTDSLRASRY